MAALLLEKLRTLLLMSLDPLIVNFKCSLHFYLFKPNSKRGWQSLLGFREHEVKVGKELPWFLLLWQNQYLEILFRLYNLLFWINNVLLLTEWEVSAGIYCPRPFPYWPTGGRSMRKRVRAIYSCTDQPTRLIRALLPYLQIPSTSLKK